MTHGKIAGVPVDISRTGYTGDLGYEIWIPWNDAPRVWDALMEKGGQFDIHPAGMLALDVARIEAGLILIEVDYFSSKRALIESQKYSPYEIGLGRMVDLKKEHFIGRDGAGRREQARAEAAADGARRSIGKTWSGSTMRWDLGPQVQSTASRAPCRCIAADCRWAKRLRRRGRRR